MFLQNTKQLNLQPLGFISLLLSTSDKMYFVVAVPKINFVKMKNTSPFITFFPPDLIPPCYEMGRFECCTTKHELVEILAGSVAPCP